MKYFNTTAVCIPSKHYMVDITRQVSEIKKMVDAGEYFVINRARQYGKTTIITALRHSIADEYDVISLDFQGISSKGFSTEEIFVQEFAGQIIKIKKTLPFIPDTIYKKFTDYLAQDNPIVRLSGLFITLNEWCEMSAKPLMLIIDEVDSATNNQVFLDFLAQLRAGYISRNTDGIPFFQSVILAGVTDIKHLKSKIRDEEQHKVNSPWNIAADFNIDMSLSEDGIREMLNEYEADHHTGMDTAYAAGFIRDYTNGYPFLVSRICELVDTNVSQRMSPLEAWSGRGLDEAVKLLLAENNTLFQSITGKLNNIPELKAAIRSVLMEGTSLPYNGQNDDVVLLQMYGLIRNENNKVRVANRIFETMLYNLFLSEEELNNNAFYKAGELGKNKFVYDGKLNMRLILERFIDTYTEICGPLEKKFKEKDGRELFLLYLKPIINGTGNYYIEAQTRDQTRTDVIVDYLGQQYIVELKIWHGERYNSSGEKQISEYLDYYNLTVGYMLSFNFNKNKATGIQRVEVGDKVLFEAVV